MSHGILDSSAAREEKRGLVVYKTAVCHRDQSCCKEDHETWLMSFIAPALKVAREPRGREVAWGSAVIISMTQWEESFFTSVAIVILFWLKWAG